jgi:heme/copper-type cytochrome/quinol oxidase subunit 2
MYPASTVRPKASYGSESLSKHTLSKGEEGEKEVDDSDADLSLMVVCIVLMVVLCVVFALLMYNEVSKKKSDEAKEEAKMAKKAIIKGVEKK